MKSTRRRIGRKLVIDGKTYHYKVCIPGHIDHSSEPNLDGHVILEIRGPGLTNKTQILSSELLSRENWLGLGLRSIKRGDKVAITPRMVADAIRRILG